MQQLIKCKVLADEEMKTDQTNEAHKYPALAKKNRAAHSHMVNAYINRLSQKYSRRYKKNQFTICGQNRNTLALKTITPDSQFPFDHARSITQPDEEGKFINLVARQNKISQLRQQQLNKQRESFEKYEVYNFTTGPDKPTGCGQKAPDPITCGADPGHSYFQNSNEFEKLKLYYNLKYKQDPGPNNKRAQRTSDLDDQLFVGGIQPWDHTEQSTAKPEHTNAFTQASKS